MREPHGSSRQDRAAHAVLFTVNQLEAAQPPALTYPMLQAASHSVSNTPKKHKARAAHRKWRGHRASLKTTQIRGK